MPGWTAVQAATGGGHISALAEEGGREWYSRSNVEAVDRLCGCDPVAFYFPIIGGHFNVVDLVNSGVSAV